MGIRICITFKPLVIPDNHGGGGGGSETVTLVDIGDICLIASAVNCLPHYYTCMKK